MVSPSPGDGKLVGGPSTEGCLCWRCTDLGLFSQAVEPNAHYHLWDGLCTSKRLLGLALTLQTLTTWRYSLTGHEHGWTQQRSTAHGSTLSPRHGTKKSTQCEVVKRQCSYESSCVETIRQMSWCGNPRHEEPPVRPVDADMI